MSASGSPPPGAKTVRGKIFSEENWIETERSATAERSLVLRGREVHGQSGVDQSRDQRGVVTSRDFDKSNEILRRTQ